MASEIAKTCTFSTIIRRRKKHASDLLACSRQWHAIISVIPNALISSVENANDPRYQIIEIQIIFLSVKNV